MSADTIFVVEFRVIDRGQWRTIARARTMVAFVTEAAALREVADYGATAQGLEYRVAEYKRRRVL